MLASQPGVVTDDTKTYLYLDPGRYVRQAVSVWDPHVGLGTVTHENIGYLLPMGPFYWALAELHVPLWVAQRLWMGCLLYAAGAGALYLCRVLGLSGAGRYVTAVAYMFTPYVLQYSGRISVILMPWSGLPWMLAFVVLALRKGGWRYPALFALVVALVSGINASSILYVGIAPALWLPYAVLVARDSTWRKAWGVAWKVAGLTILRVALVGGGAADRGGLRRQRPQVHRDRARHQRSVPGLGDPPRARLLVLLRHRPGRPVDADLGRLHAEHLPDPVELQRAGAGRPGRLHRPVALPELLPPADGGGHGARRRAQPLRAPLGRRLRDQEDHGRHHRGAGHALDGPCLPAHHPQPGRLPRRRGERACTSASVPSGCSSGVVWWSPSPAPPPRCGPGRSSPTGSPSRPHRRRTCAPPPRPSTAPTPAPASTPCPATTSAPNGGATPSTPCTRAS